MDIDFDIRHFMPTEGNKVYIKQMKLDADHYVDTHKHTFDHWGLLGSGYAMVELDGEKSFHTGPCVIEIKAEKEHRITALTDITWFCIHNTDITDESKIDEVLIKKGE